VRPGVSAIVITRNEERNIAGCLASVSWADEIVVVDAESADRTSELARAFTQNVIVAPWEGFAAAKNLALRHTTCEWAFWIDADERASPELGKEVAGLVRGEGAAPHDGYEVARRAFFIGKWIRHCGWYPGYVVRLFRKGAGVFTRTRVHERLELRGSTGRLSNDLEHYTDETLYHYFTKLNSYTTLAAQDANEGGKRSSVLDLLARPAYMFFRMYFLRLGFLDGAHGLTLSLLSASYVFAKHAKLRELGSATRPHRH
jgi:glycosyltransferase involved in cell wall biosynthesis